MAHQPDYIQLRDIKRFAQESFRALKTQWYVPFGLFLLLGTYKVYRAWTYAPEYEARLSFMIAEEPIGLEGSLGGVLSSIGLSSESSYNHERFIQLAKSRKIFQKAVMDTVSIDGHPKLLANALIDEFERYARWGKNHWYEFFKDPPALRGYRFRDTQITAGPPLARLALNSLRGLLREKESLRARLRDQLRYASSESALVPLEKLTKEINLLYIMLGEVVKNKELADFALRSKTPIVQAIDLPLKPLPSYAPLWWMELFRAAVLAFLLGGLFVLLRHWWRVVE